jgi:2-dehydro-3-deoxyphosphogluconate aldolase/(4S)-4-hydroxy-2-oxoglutarate aldolase
MSRAKEEVLERIHRVGLVPVVRASSATEALAIAAAIAAGGVTVLEIAMTVPNAVEVIRTLVRERPELLIGAGTVPDAEAALICMDAGAEFIVSPSTDVGTIEFCVRQSLAVLPGALTPTEIVIAWKAGADAVKVFPVSAMGGARYLRSLKAPLPHIGLVPTGGVSLDTAMEFLAAGAFALGVGAELADASAIADGQPEKITDTARAYLRVIAEWRAATGS